MKSTVLQHRETIHDFMKNDPESPLPDSLISKFNRLSYFAPDISYKVRATLERIPGDDIINMATSDGASRSYIRYAYAAFEMLGGEHKLTLLKPVEEDQELFLPFGDKTNGESTYGGGRYINLEMTSGNKITIDFNLAYNPYCVYSPDFSCPLPPVENQLKVAINAGEKNFGLP